MKERLFIYGGFGKSEILRFSRLLFRMVLTPVRHDRLVQAKSSRTNSRRLCALGLYYLRGTNPKRRLVHKRHNYASTMVMERKKNVC